MAHGEKIGLHVRAPAFFQTADLKYKFSTGQLSDLTGKSHAPGKVPCTGNPDLRDFKILIWLPH